MKHAANLKMKFVRATKSSVGLGVSNLRNSSPLDSRDRERELERGSIESGLVLIPTTLFFLMILQVLLAGSWQTIERARLHDLVIENSIKDSNFTDLRRSDQEFESSRVQLFERSPSNLDNHLGTQPMKSRSLSVSQRATPIGTFQLFEMSTEIPILGEFFRAMDVNLFRVNNRAVSFIN
jgi:hypothetical protein